MKMRTISGEVPEEIHKQFTDLAWYRQKPIKKMFAEAIVEYLRNHHESVERAQGFLKESQDERW